MNQQTEGGHRLPAYKLRNLMQRSGNDSATLVDEVLAAALRIFAERGRAIREERRKLQVVQMLNIGVSDNEATKKELKESTAEENVRNAHS